MINELDDRIYFNPGQIVTIKHDIENKPKMMVVEKATRSLINRETGNKENIFLGVRCRWFDKNQDLQEAIFSTKDLIHV